MKLFEFDSYKDYLKYLVENNFWKITLLAEVAGCNRSYLSQVLNSKVQLTSDHIINLSENLSLNELEKEYFINLGLFERAALPATINTLERKLNKIKNDALKISKQINLNEEKFNLKDELKAEYFSNRNFGQIHLLTSIESYQTVEAISSKINLGKKSVIEILNKLVVLDLVKKSGTKFSYKSGNIHVPDHSPFNVINQLNWRIHAVQSISKTSGIHYTSTFTISKKDFNKLKSELLTFIEKQRVHIGKSGTEEIYCFNCDLFES